jgi:hypothetical protein
VLLVLVVAVVVAVVIVVIVGILINIKMVAAIVVTKRINPNTCKNKQTYEYRAQVRVRQLSRIISEYNK